MQSERRWLLGGNLLTSLSIALGYPLTVDLLEEVRKSKVKDDKVVKAVEEMKWARVKMLRDEEWREVDSIMYKERKVCMPKDEKLRAEIIRLHHDTPIGGHGGQ